MAPTEYHKTGGSLKLKGAALGPAKKKKKSSVSKRLREEEEAVASGSGGEGSERDAEGGNSSNATNNAEVASGKTAAQLRFEEVQKARLLEKAAKAATMTHKERVAQFNEKLEALSEHYDIPKVGPG